MKPVKQLRDGDITTRHPARRTVLGLVAASGVAALVPGAAQAQDNDNGNWADVGDCPRGEGGLYTAYTDADDGNWTDDPGYGRGAPRC